MRYFKNLWKAVTNQNSCCKVQCKVINDKGETEWIGDLEKWFVNYQYENFEPTLVVQYTLCSGKTGIKKVKISG